MTQIGLKIIRVNIGVVVLGTTLFAFVWFLYFVCRVWQSSKKVHYLKKQTNERCREELTNARVDHYKNMFICFICLAELIGGVDVFITTGLLSTVYSSPVPITGCEVPSHSIVEMIFHYKFVRVCILVGVSSCLIYMSLVHTLTSYMANAYAKKRVVKLSRREKLLLLLLFTQLVVIWLSVFHWRVFIVLLTLVLSCMFPFHLFIFYKYSRELYSAIRRRTLDAWFEDTELHRRLDGMRKEYYRSSIAYALSVILFTILLGTIVLVTFFQSFYNHPCTLNQLFHTNLTLLNGFKDTTRYSINVSFEYIRDLCILCVVSWVLVLHLYILGQAGYRQIKRRIAYNRYTGIRRTELYRPLIGNN